MKLDLDALECGLSRELLKAAALPEFVQAFTQPKPKLAPIAPPVERGRGTSGVLDRNLLGTSSPSTPLPGWATSITDQKQVRPQTQPVPVSSPTPVPVVPEVATRNSHLPLRADAQRNQHGTLQYRTPEGQRVTEYATTGQADPNQDKEYQELLKDPYAEMRRAAGTGAVAGAGTGVIGGLGGIVSGAGLGAYSGLKTLGRNYDNVKFSPVSPAQLASQPSPLNPGVSHTEASPQLSTPYETHPILTGPSQVIEGFRDPNKTVAGAIGDVAGQKINNVVDSLSSKPTSANGAPKEPTFWGNLWDKLKSGNPALASISDTVGSGVDKLREVAPGVVDGITNVLPGVMGILGPLMLMRMLEGNKQQQPTVGPGGGVTVNVNNGGGGYRGGYTANSVGDLSHGLKFGSLKLADVVTDALANAVRNRVANKAIDGLIGGAKPPVTQPQEEENLQIISRDPAMAKLLADEKNKAYLNRLLAE